MAFSLAQTTTARKARVPLIPTGVHLVVVLLSAFTRVPPRYKSWLAAHFAYSETSSLRPLRGAVIGASVGLIYSGIVAGGLTGLGWLAVYYRETLALALLDTVRGIATAAGLMA
jgi:hypothetical protein